jgi:hypothetical protein
MPLGNRLMTGGCEERAFLAKGRDVVFDMIDKIVVPLAVRRHRASVRLQNLALRDRYLDDQ